MMNVFSERQKNLSKACSRNPILLGAYDKMQLSGDMAAPFQQEANFLWLTGIAEPGWRLLVVDSEERYVVAPKVDEVHGLFETQLGTEEASALSGAKAISYTEFERILTKVSITHKTVYALDVDPHERYYDFVLNPGPRNMWHSAVDVFDLVRDVRPILKKLRALKSEAELEVQRQAIRLTCDAFKKIKDKMSDLPTEVAIENEFTYIFGCSGAKHAYEPIVAGGSNALTLHYTSNTQALPANGIVLIDIGARIGGYTADITRTYAVGDPSAREVAVHKAVEKAHHDIIDLIKPGVLLADYQTQSDEIMKQALDGLGLLKDPEDYRKYFPHAISHGLGIDVHESLGGFESFQPGMVLTVEPGIYIPEEGIGVRIEDDILVTEHGHENLSAGLPTGL